jgi:hypothetical protein
LMMTTQTTTLASRAATSSMVIRGRLRSAITLLSPSAFDLSVGQWSLDSNTY